MAVVNQAFVKRFFREGEDRSATVRAGQTGIGDDIPDRRSRRGCQVRRLGTEVPRHADVFCDAGGRRWRIRPVTCWSGSKCGRHFIGGLMLTTDMAPGAIEPGGHEDPGGCRPESDDHQRTGDAGAGGFALRSGSRGRQPGGFVRRGRAGAGRGRALWRDGLRSGAAAQRDRNPDGAGGRPRQGRGAGAAGDGGSRRRRAGDRNAAGCCGGPVTRSAVVRRGELGPGSAGSGGGRAGGVRLPGSYRFGGRAASIPAIEALRAD